MDNFVLFKHVKVRSFLLASCLLSLISGISHAQSQDEIRYTNLLGRLNAMRAETQYVEDINAITKLGRAFGFYLDKGYFGQAANLFTEDGRVMYGNDGIYIGQARIKELFTRQGGGSMNAGPGLPFGRFNMHMQLQPLVTIAEDGQSAQARWREWMLLGNYKVKAEWGDAIQENDYVKEGDVWKISEMRVYINFIAPYQGGWAALERRGPDWKTETGEVFNADQPTPDRYRPFPDVFVPPFHYANDNLDARRAIQAPPPLDTIMHRPGDDLGVLEAEADAQAVKLARQHSLRAVENLQAMYGYYFDKGLWSEAAALFTEGGTWEFGQLGVYQGKQSIAQGMSVLGSKGLELGQLNNFPMLQPVIHVSEDNSRAWGRFRSDVMRSVDGKGQWGGGLYENEYVNEGGTWKIAKQHYWVTFWGDYDKGWTGEGVIPMQTMSTSIPPDAPPSVEYESFPNTYIVPFHYDHPVTGEPHRDMERLAADKAAGKNVR